MTAKTITDSKPEMQTPTAPDSPTAALPEQRAGTPPAEPSTTDLAAVRRVLSIRAPTPQQPQKT